MLNWVSFSQNIRIWNHFFNNEFDYYIGGNQFYSINMKFTKLKINFTLSNFNFVHMQMIFILLKMKFIITSNEIYTNNLELTKLWKKSVFFHSMTSSLPTQKVAKNWKWMKSPDKRYESERMRPKNFFLTAPKKVMNL